MNIPADALVKCMMCEVEVTGHGYHDARGWRCGRCAPAREACKYQAQGCAYTDIDTKCKKHEVYFCEQSSWCCICFTQVSPGGLSAHNASRHQDVTYESGSKWRLTRGGLTRLLVSSAAGPALCEYWLVASQFLLQVHIPVPSERLSEFRCVVRLSDPAAGYARTYTPEVDYESPVDWYIRLEKEEFPSQNDLLDISIEIKNVNN